MNKIGKFDQGEIETDTGEKAIAYFTMNPGGATARVQCALALHLGQTLTDDDGHKWTVIDVNRNPAGYSWAEVAPVGSIEAAAIPGAAPVSPPPAPTPEPQPQPETPE